MIRQNTIDELKKMTTEMEMIMKPTTNSSIITNPFYNENTNNKNINNENININNNNLTFTVSDSKQES